MDPFNTLYNGLYETLTIPDQEDLVETILNYDSPSLIVNNGPSEAFKSFMSTSQVG